MELDAFKKAVAPEDTILRYLDITDDSPAREELLEALKVAREYRALDPENYDAAAEYALRVEIEWLCQGPLGTASDDELIKQCAKDCASFMVSEHREGRNPGERLLEIARLQGWQANPFTQQWAEEQRRLFDLRTANDNEPEAEEPAA